MPKSPADRRGDPFSSHRLPAPGIGWLRYPIPEVIPLRPLHFAPVGGDARQLFLSDLLVRDGHAVTRFALSPDVPDLTGLGQFPVVVLPMPLTRDGICLNAPLCPHPVPLTRLSEALQPGQTVFSGGQLPVQPGVKLRNYAARKELAVANAVPTAEGALLLALETLPTTVHRSRVLVVGFGRVGQCTAARFHALGAHVTVAARDPVRLALAESMGCAPCPLSQLAGPFELVVNTVPAPVLPKATLERLGRPVLMELASAPGGYDPAEAAALGLRHIPAPGLPGKYFPAAAGKILQTTLYSMLEEEESLE